MLDTIRVKWPIAPTQEMLLHWTHKVTYKQESEKHIYIYNPKVNETMLKFTFYPLGFDGQPLLTLEVSLPKLIFSHNYKMLSSTEDAIRDANAILANVPNIPHLDIGEGVLIRLDMCYNHQVGDLVSAYIEAIGNLEYPHRRAKHHRTEGVEFRSKHKTTKFYDKEIHQK